jgi:hypothetical protein
MRRSRVVARATGVGERAIATIPSRQPWNHGPDDAGSIGPTRGARAPRCFRALFPEVALVAGLAERRLEGAHDAAVAKRA